MTRGLVNRPIHAAPLSALLALAVLLLPCGCGKQDANDAQPAGPDTSKQPPIVLIGLDGLEWDVMRPMLHGGRLPAMAALMKRGTYGFLRTFRPTLSPVIWTSIATGKGPEDHGITNFVKSSSSGQLQELFTNLDRRTKAFWNIASDFNKRVAVIGWWMTFPVEPVNGVMVAQTNTGEQLDTYAGKNVWKGQLIRGVPGQVYPPNRQNAVMELLAAVEESLPELTTRIFGRFPHPKSVLGQRLWANTEWAFRADATYARLAEDLLAGPEPYDLLAVYLGGTDVVGHRFWRYMKPDRYKHPPSPQQVANFSQVIENYYAYADHILGRLVEQAGPHARIIVISDHGMKAINTAQQFSPDDPPQDVNSAHHKNAEPGIIIAAGPDIPRLDSPMPPNVLLQTDLKWIATVLDVTPTILALMDVPVGQDMPGRARQTLIEPTFLAAHPVRTVPTHDTPEWFEARQKPLEQIPGLEERLEQLRSLGYIAE